MDVERWKIWLLLAVVFAVVYGYAAIGLSGPTTTGAYEELGPTAYTEWESGSVITISDADVDDVNERWTGTSVLLGSSQFFLARDCTADPFDDSFLISWRCTSTTMGWGSAGARLIVAMLAKQGATYDQIDALGDASEDCIAVMVRGAGTSLNSIRLVELNDGVMQYDTTGTLAPDVIYGMRLVRDGNEYTLSIWNDSTGAAVDTLALTAAGNESWTWFMACASNLYAASTESMWADRYYIRDVNALDAWYVDPVNGNDLYSGIEPVWDGHDGPWQTCAYAEDHIGPGDTVYLMDGNEVAYGVLLLNRDVTAQGRTGYVDGETWTVYPGASATFARIYLAWACERYCTLDGLDVKNPIGTGTADYGLKISNGADYAHLVNMTLVGYVGTDVTTDSEYGIYNEGGKDITVEGCEVSYFLRLINFSNGYDNFHVVDCNLHHSWASFIHTDGLGTDDKEDFLLQDCVVHTRMAHSLGHSQTLYAGDYTTIRRCTFYGTSGSISIMGFGDYPDPPQEPIHDVTVEDCLVYNPNTSHALLRITSGTENIRIVGNTLVHGKNTTDYNSLPAESRYVGVLSVGYYGSGSDANCVIAGNICGGMTTISSAYDDPNLITGNLFWSLTVGGVDVNSYSDNLIICQTDTYLNGYDPNYLDDAGNVWAGGPLWTSHAQPIETNYVPPYPRSVDMRAEYQLSTGSAALDLADPTFSSATDRDGTARDPVTPDAGSEEYVPSEGSSGNRRIIITSWLPDEWGIDPWQQ